MKFLSPFLLSLLASSMVVRVVDGQCVQMDELDHWMMLTYDNTTWTEAALEEALSNPAQQARLDYYFYVMSWPDVQNCQEFDCVYDPWQDANYGTCGARRTRNLLRHGKEEEQFEDSDGTDMMVPATERELQVRLCSKCNNPKWWRRCHKNRCGKRNKRRRARGLKEEGVTTKELATKIREEKGLPNPADELPKYAGPRSRKLKIKACFNSRAPHCEEVMARIDKAKDLATIKNNIQYSMQWEFDNHEDKLAGEKLVIELFDPRDLSRLETAQSGQYLYEDYLDECNGSSDTECDNRYGHLYPPGQMQCWDGGICFCPFDANESSANEPDPNGEFKACGLHLNVPPKTVSNKVCDIARPDFQGECATEFDCETLYPDYHAFGCDNRDGGVCMCDYNQVCGCLKEKDES